MNEILSLAVKAAQASGRMILESSKNIDTLKIEQKSLHDYVSEVDRNSELIIRDLIREIFPNHAFIGEEFGEIGKQTSEYQWVVDPLDGTTNFLREIPHYAVSIAVLRNQVLEHAVVFDPAKDELFCASRGDGCTLNGNPISVSNAPSIEGALLATGVPFSGQLLIEIDSFTATMNSVLAKQTSGIRRLGSAALDLAYVAAGRYDAFWEARLQPWDIAAGALLVSEAGGRVSDFNGNHRYMQSGDIVAASPNVMAELVSTTQKCYQR